MDVSANIKSVEALAELNRALGRFSGDLQDSLTAIDREIAQVQQWFDERERYCQYKMKQSRENINRIQNSLQHCLSQENADCSAYHHALSKAQWHLQNAEEEWQNLQSWISTVQEAALDYKRQARQLANQVNEVPKARAFIEGKIDDSDAYIKESNDFKNLITQFETGMREGFDSHHTPAMAQGKAAEEVALSSNEDRISLDNIVDKLNFSQKGNHFYVYDNISISGEVSSVKNLGIYKNLDDLNEGKRQKLNNDYVKAFRKAIGTLEEQKFEQAATMLLEAKEKNLIPIAEKMAKIKNVNEMKSYLHDYAVLQIPDDYVSHIQKEVKKDIINGHTRYGFTKTPTSDDIERMIQRIKPIGATSQLSRYIINAFRPQKRQEIRRDTLKGLNDLYRNINNRIGGSVYKVVMIIRLFLK